MKNAIDSLVDQKIYVLNRLKAPIMLMVYLPDFSK